MELSSSLSLLGLPKYARGGSTTIGRMAEHRLADGQLT
jgi:hypothetical protein